MGIKRPSLNVGRNFIWPVILSLIFLSAASPLLTAEDASIGKAMKVSGHVEAVKLSGERRVLKPGDYLYLGEQLTTGASGFLQMELHDQSVFSLAANSSLMLDEFIYKPDSSDGSIHVTVIKGIIRFITGEIVKKNPSNMKVKLPSGSIGIRGTTFIVEVKGEEALVVLVETKDPETGDTHAGHITVTGTGGQVIHLTEIGCGTRVAEGRPPADPSAPEETDYIRLLLETGHSEAGKEQNSLKYRSGSCSGNGEAAEKKALDRPEDPSGETSAIVQSGQDQRKETQLSLDVSPPTIPLPPPILPSFYNKELGLDSVASGRSLTHAFSVCGDSIYDPGEDCDDGNRDPGDGCSDLCRLEDPLGCGDKSVNPGEQCDDGNILDGDGCSATCQLEGSCGNGSVDPGEECDDGNRRSGDGCSKECAREETKPDAAEPVPEEEPEPDVKDPRGEQPDPDLEDEGEDEIPQSQPEEPVVTYEQGRAITNVPGCTGTCVFEVTRSPEGQVIQRREVFSERRLDPGSTYTDPVFGEVYCSTGRGVENSESARSRNEEAAVTLTPAQIVGCQP